MAPNDATAFDQHRESHVGSESHLSRLGHVANCIATSFRCARTNLKFGGFGAILKRACLSKLAISAATRYPSSRRSPRATSRTSSARLSNPTYRHGVSGALRLDTRPMPKGLSSNPARFRGPPPKLPPARSHLCGCSSWSLLNKQVG